MVGNLAFRERLSRLPFWIFGDSGGAHDPCGVKFDRGAALVPVFVWTALQAYRVAEWLLKLLRQAAEAQLWVGGQWTGWRAGRPVHAPRLGSVPLPDRAFVTEPAWQATVAPVLRLCMPRTHSATVLLKEGRDPSSTRSPSYTIVLHYPASSHSLASFPLLVKPSLSS